MRGEADIHAQSNGASANRDISSFVAEFILSSDLTVWELAFIALMKDKAKKQFGKNAYKYVLEDHTTPKAN